MNIYSSILYKRLNAISIFILFSIRAFFAFITLEIYKINFYIIDYNIYEY